MHIRQERARPSLCFCVTCREISAADELPEGYAPVSQLVHDGFKDFFAAAADTVKVDAARQCIERLCFFAVEYPDKFVGIVAAGNVEHAAELTVDSVIDSYIDNCAAEVDYSIKLLQQPVSSVSAGGYACIGKFGSVFASRDITSGRSNDIMT